MIGLGIAPEGKPYHYYYDYYYYYCYYYHYYFSYYYHHYGHNDDDCYGDDHQHRQPRRSSDIGLKAGMRLTCRVGV